MVTGMLTRTITGVIGAAIMLTLFTLPQPIPVFTVAVIWLIAIYEFGHALKAKPVGIALVAIIHIVILGLLLSPLFINSLPILYSDLYIDILIVAACLLPLLLSIQVFRSLLAGKGRIVNYCWHSFVFISLPLCWTAAWSFWVMESFSLILILGLAAANDTGAVAAGKLFGHRRIVPRISPGKTLEGIIGGFAALTAFVIILYFVLAHFHASGLYIDLTSPSRWVLIVLTCAWLAFVGFIGDITFSAIKRNSGIKDFGAILPGHGGMLDRIDSLLFIAPWYFLVFKIILDAWARQLGL